MKDDPELEMWKSVGALLASARERRHLSKREAARRAGFAEITWRQLEAGQKQIARGVVVPVSPKDETLVAACRAVRLDPAEAFALAGRRYDAAEWPDTEKLEEAEIALLKDEIASLRSQIGELTDLVRGLGTPPSGPASDAERDASPSERASTRSSGA